MLILSNGNLGLEDQIKEEGEEKPRGWSILPEESPLSALACNRRKWIEILSDRNLGSEDKIKEGEEIYRR